MEALGTTDIPLIDVDDAGPRAKARKPLPPADPVPYFKLHLTDADIGAVVEVLRSGWIGQGPRTAKFEAAFSQHQGGGHAVATNSCTSALHTALVALGVEEGDGVLLSTHAWVSAAEAIANCGALPILVDCTPEDQAFDLKDAAAKMQMAAEGRLPQAKGRVVPVKGFINVYYSGLMADEPAMRRFADENGIWFLADCAHALTAEWQDATGAWQPCGAGLADVYCYSFYPNKTITTGDGGMALTRDPELAERMRRVRNHGLSFDTWEGEELPSWDRCVTMRGFKYTMTDIDAALGLTQLAQADALADARRAIAARYRMALQEHPGIGVVPERAGKRSSYHLFPIRLLGQGGAPRNHVLDTLRARGVDCRVHWRPLHLQPYYRDMGWAAEHCPQSSASWTELVSLPIFPAMTRQQVDQVIAELRKVLKELKEVAPA